MPQSATLTEVTTQTISGCPAWCQSGPHEDGSPHFGGLRDIDLTSREGTSGSDFATVALWQDTGSHRPVISLETGIGMFRLPDMTLSDAEAVARAILDLVRAGLR